MTDETFDMSQPPGPGEVHLYFRAGEGVTLSDAALRALETLAQELNADDVSGFLIPLPRCPAEFINPCSLCIKMKCQPVVYN